MSVVWISNVSSHAGWAERMAVYEAACEGRFEFVLDPEATVGAWLVDPNGQKIAAVKFEFGAGIAAALNTLEGRRAYARVVIQGE